MQEEREERADAVGRLHDDDQGVTPHLLAVIVLHAAVAVVSDASGHRARGRDGGGVYTTHPGAVDLTSSQQHTHLSLIQHMVSSRYSIMPFCLNNRCRRVIRTPKGIIIWGGDIGFMGLVSEVVW